jgi:TIR domain
MDKFRFFISYPRKDAAWASEFADSLIKRGVSVWFDQHQIGVGDIWTDAIEAGLRESESIVVILTSENLGSPSLSFEIGAAIGMHKKIVPIVSEDLPLSALPREIRIRQYLIRRSPEATADELVSAIGPVQNSAGKPEPASA